MQTLYLPKLHSNCGPSGSADITEIANCDQL